MAPNPTPPRVAPIAVADSGGTHWLGWASLVLSLVFPLTYTFVLVTVLIGNLTPNGGNPFAASLYTIFDYAEWPLPLLAVVLAHIALARSSSARGVALAALALGYVSILVLLGTVIALALSSAPNAH